jgi:Ni,Fe-hydrogenase III large subunit/Ni,Fe-hydrogenase III component G
MDLSRLGFATAVLPAAVPARRCPVNGMGLLASCRVAWEQGAHLLALWGSDDRDRDRGYTLHAVVQDAEGLVMFELTLPTGDSTYPDLAVVFPAANRMQRATFDLLGLASEADDQRPWVWQASWPIDQFPLRRDFEALAKWQPGQEEYAFVRVEGDGVHEIPVGPVHAGIIEPGHFRFQVVGEKVLRLEERLCFVHKGIEKRFEAMAAATGYRLAGRVSGDSTVAYAWAYAQALEAICGTAPPVRAQWLRALVLERERIANHLGDLGYLGNDGGFAFGLAQFSRLKGARAPHEPRALRPPVRDGLDRPRWRRTRPGAGGRRDDRRRMPDAGTRGARAARHLRRARRPAGSLPCLRRRDAGARAGRSASSASRGRASGQARDLRCDFPTLPYDALGVRKAASELGDVAARVAVRFDEIFESLRLVRSIAAALPEGNIAAEIPEPPPFRTGLGLVEGWRGPVMVALECGPGGTIRRCHPHDPSWTNWPVLEHAVIGNIVPDFPLINKSFNLSYSGQDL